MKITRNNILLKTIVVKKMIGKYGRKIGIDKMVKRKGEENRKLYEKTSDYLEAVEELGILDSWENYDIIFKKIGIN